MKKFVLAAILIVSLIGIGLIGGWMAHSLYLQTHQKVLCIRGSSEHTIFFDELTGRSSFIGQQIICAENWQLSPVYGPTIEKWIEEGIEFDEPTERYGGEDRVETKP